MENDPLNCKAAARKDKRQDDDDTGAGGNGSNSTLSLTKKPTDQQAKASGTKSTGSVSGSKGTTEKPLAMVSPQNVEDGLVYVWCDKKDLPLALDFVPEKDGLGIEKPVSTL